jgi:ribosome-associated protein
VGVSEETLGQLEIAAKAAGDKLAENLVALDVSQPFALAEVFLICSAKNDRQVLAISDAIEDAMREAGNRIRFAEGKEAARWVLLDFGDLVVHVMHESEREFYSLERLWRDCPVVPVA